MRELFRDCDYTSVDLQLGRAWTWPARGTLLELPTGHFDTVISAECFEHSPFWRETFANMLRMTRPAAWLLLSCATTGRKGHGTSRTNPDTSPFGRGQWDYYRNLRASDLTHAAPRGLAGRLGLLDQLRRLTSTWQGCARAARATLDAELRRTLDARYAMSASAQALRRGPGASVT